jgi:branched-subunit amino acid transport protein
MVKGDLMTKSFWCCAVMTLLSASVSAGFSLVGLFGPGSGDSFARYAASRSVALLLTVVIAICVRSRMAVAVLGIAMTVVQAFDGVIGALAHDPSKTYGPFALAVLNALVVIWLLRGKEEERRSSSRYKS